MTYSTLMGPERRRRFTEDQKLAVLSAAFAPGASVADVARQADVCTSVIYRWRRAYSAAAPSGFAPVVVIDDGAQVGAAGAAPAMVVEFAGGARVSIAGTAGAALVTAVLRALR
jgi:transposase